MSNNFPTTHWSLVVRAGEGEKVALETLCKAYWQPLYCYIRGRGLTPQDAEDELQAFFWHLLSGGRIAHADEERGRFRSWLRVCLRNFLNDSFARHQAAKRGGAATVIDVDTPHLEAELSGRDWTAQSPEEWYMRAWASSVLDAALTDVRVGYAQRQKEEIFAALTPVLLGNYPGTLKDAGMSVGLSQSAAKVALHRLRKRVTAALKVQVRETVTSYDQIDEELSALDSVLS